MNFNMENKVVIITGANSGIGKQAAIQMACLGAHVVMACRSMERGEAAREEICRESSSQQVDLLRVDMSSLESIREFSQEYHKRYSQLHVLIHNAANFDLSIKTPVLTREGIETFFATNHVGIFLMTKLLIDLLQASAPSRIITVASKGLLAYPNLDIEFDNLNGERRFSAAHAYYHSKLAQVMYTYDLAERLKGSGVTANCIRVGNVAVEDDRLMGVPNFLKKVYALKRKFAVTPERQAEAYVFLAADPDVEQISGGYWDERGQQVRSSRASCNRETRERLWRVTEELAERQAT